MNLRGIPNMRLVLKQVVIFAISLFLPLSAYSFAADNVRESAVLWNQERDGCKPGLYKQANGPMAIILFCEDALGIYIGLVYYDNMTSPVPDLFYKKLSEEEKKTYYKTWSLDNRMWQASIWASDVTSYAWSPDGNKLYVGTSDIYGSGGLYELDLVRRKHKQIAPSDKEVNIEKPGPGYIITRLDTEKGNLYYKSAHWNTEQNSPQKELTYKLK
jgi:hypothetical protein